MVEQSKSNILAFDRATIDRDVAEMLVWIKQDPLPAGRATKFGRFAIAFTFALILCPAGLVYSVMSARGTAAPSEKLTGIETRVPIKPYAAVSSHSGQTLEVSNTALPDKYASMKRHSPILEDRRSVEKVHEVHRGAITKSQGANSSIANPLEGEALRLALIEDHRRTRELNDVSLASMAARSSN